MAGRALRGMHRTADYKDGEALKSCHTEFVHIYGAAFFQYKGETSKEVSPFCFNTIYLEFLSIV
ncbi:MAG: hypothetical protein LUE98_21540 [Tannerellaceae bacterium]|nr:hypothetical protein [Tannerellaceae bacterium]